MVGVEVEETVEEKVKEEVEAKVVEDKVVEEKVVWAGQWLRVLWGGQDGGVHRTLPRDPAVMAPTPQTSTTPSSSPRRALLDSPFFDVPCASQSFVAGEVGVGGRGGGGAPEQTPADGGGGGCRDLVVATGVAREE